MDVPTMRTRYLSRLPNGEVEKYLARNDIIFVPVGTIELHGAMPLDTEYVGPLAFAQAMAEEIDGLVLDGLQYFYAGATTIGRGAVQMSIRSGYDYLKEIARSLMCQGFRRQVYVTGHGPAELTVAAMALDFFDETKVPLAYIDMARTLNYTAKKRDVAKDGPQDYHDIIHGTYEILGRREDLPVDPNVYPEVHGQAMPPSLANITHMVNFGGFAYSLPFYFGDLTDHGPTNAPFRTVEEREAACLKGLEELRRTVRLMDLPQYMKQFSDQMAYTEEVIKPKYGRYLPKIRHVDWT